MQKKVLITGVLGGIGGDLAKTFHDNGYYVIGLDIKEGPCAFSDLFIRFDLNQYCENEVYKAEMDLLFEDKIPYLNVLINNAAVQILSDLENIQLADWRQTLNVNLTGPLLLSQLFCSRLTQNRGCIINIASIHERLTKRKFISYATSKSAIVGLTKAMSVDLQGAVRVNSISPAAIDTPMLHDGFDNDITKIQQLDKLHPSQRIGKPFEVAQLALFMAKDEIRFLNGANIQIDGGISNVLKDLE